MAPVHRAPRWAVRVMLEESVEPAVEKAEAIRVIDPATRGCDMERGVPAVIGVVEGLHDGTFLETLRASDLGFLRD